MTAFHIGLIVVACLVVLGLVVGLCTRNASTAAGASIAPVLLFFFLIALMAKTSEANKRPKKPVLPRVLAFVGIATLAAVCFWHTELTNACSAFWHAL
ncbi:MAG: hypothetical protein P4L53_06285 [Candidatus Obscuribacterales bacterium]|nr:hypothetical protein [Candidatus Obscuribacterales bacterium]